MLTIKQIDAAKPKDKPYRLLDSNGLYLYVPVSGKKVWQLRYKIDGKEKVLTVGKYPLMSLQEAREKASLARKDVSVGVDRLKRKNYQLKTTLLALFTMNGMSTKSRYGRWDMLTSWRGCSGMTSCQ